MGIGGWLQDNVPGVEEVTDAVSDGAEWVEDGINDGADWVEQTVSDGAADVGGWLDDRSHDVADALDHVGWESGADWVEDRGDDAADALGAEVPEKELGQTEDKTELVHGEVEKLDELSNRLNTFSGHMADASSGLGAIDPGMWEGSSSAGFEAKMSKQPGAWDAASDACSSAATAISDYAGTVTWAQGRAQAAIDQYQRGVAASERATTEYNRQVDHYNANRDKPEGERPERPGEFVDPGLADREAAQDTLDAARRRRDEAGSAAQTAVTGATADAPEEPEFTEEVAGTLSDLDGMADVWGAHLTMGALKGVTGLAAFVRTLNPNDQWNVRNPAAYQENLSNLAAGLVTAVTNPQQTLESLLEGFTTDPAEAIGMLIPELIGAKGLGKLGSLGRLDGPDGPDTPRGPDGPDATAPRRLPDEQYGPDALGSPADLSSALDRVGWSRDELIDAINTDPRTLSPDEIADLNRVRDAVPTPDGDTLMQKIITPEQQGQYLGERPAPSYFTNNGIGGSLTRADDTAHLNTPGAVHDGLRLDYPDSVFSPGDDTVTAIRFRTDGAVEAPRISDLGGGGQYDGWDAPFTGNGFTKSHDDVVPEWQPAGSAKTVEMRDGAEMWTIDKSGEQRRIAVFDDGEWVRTP